MTFTKCQLEENMGIQYELSGFSVLASAMEQAIKELEAQNYGNAKQILTDALENTREFYIVNKDNRYDTFK